MYSRLLLAAKATKECLLRLYTDSVYEYFYKGAVADSKNLTDDQTKGRIDEGTQK